MTQTDPNTSNNVETKQTYGIEELQVVGEQLVGKVKELVREGNVRRIIIKQEGHTILEIPLVVGVAGVLIAPVWAAIGVVTRPVGRAWFFWARGFGKKNRTRSIG